MTKISIDNFINDTTKRAHLVGVGGVSMSSLAETLLARGIFVSGSDMRNSEATHRLEEKGVRLLIGHNPSNVDDIDYVIRTAAVKNDNPEIAAAIDKGIPVFERAEAWGSIMKNHDEAICIAGVHGKTTTSSMVTHIALAGDFDPAVMIGGNLSAIGGGHRIGKGPIILESCEYCNSFLSFHPTVAVILNVDADHLDFFKDLEDISNSFRKFALLTPENNGVVVANADDYNTMKCIEGIDRHIITFGLKNAADVTAERIKLTRGLPEYDIIYRNKKLCHVKMLVPGEHNILNALAAAAAALGAGFDDKSIERGLSSYAGVGRRFEYKGQINGAMIYDDYAHHPSEIKALLDAVSFMEYDRVICAFQPHTFTRTAAFFDDFVEQLSRADMLILADVFAAREKNTVGVTSADLAKRIEGSYLIPDFDDMANFIAQIAKAGDIILTVGAGELNIVSNKLSKMKPAKKNEKIFDFDISAGGLRNLNDVKILICYLLKTAGGKVRKELLYETLQKDGMSGFWYITQALDELKKNETILETDEENESVLLIQNSGLDIANQLETVLPLTIREKVTAESLRLISRSSALEQNKVEINKNNNGEYIVSIKIMEGETELLSTNIPAYDSIQAGIIKEKFLANPSEFYKKVIGFFE